MKTLILYATKYGAAYEVAKRIAKKIDGAEVCDLKKSSIPSISEYDCIVIGSSLYAGMIRKEAKQFLLKNAEVLCGKRIGLFLSGMDTDAGKQEGYFKENFPPELLQAAKAKCSAGGIYDPKKAGVAERFIFKIVAKQIEFKDSINYDRISKFVVDMAGGKAK